MRIQSRIMVRLRVLVVPRDRRPSFGRSAEHVCWPVSPPRIRSGRKERKSRNKKEMIGKGDRKEVEGGDKKKKRNTEAKEKEENSRSSDRTSFAFRRLSHTSPAAHLIRGRPSPGRCAAVPLNGP